MSEAGLTERIAQWVESTTFDSLPRRVVEEAKNQILSVVASVHAGHFSEVGKSVRRAIKDWPVAKDATMLPSGERSSLYNALFTNCALGAALDYDDYLFATHCGHSSVLAPLALAEKVGMTGKELLLTQVIINEVCGRFGAALLTAAVPMQAQTVVHLVGGALAGAKALGLDREGIQAALGLALLQPGLPLERAYFGSDARALATATTTPLGVQAAQLVAGGLRGPLDVLEHPDGFFVRASSTPLTEAFDSLGKAWLTETLCYKIYPAGAGMGTVLDCVLDMVRQHTVDVKKIRAVQIAACPATLDLDRRAAAHVVGPQTPPSVLAGCVAYNVAAALTDREMTARQLTRERIADPAVWALAAKVSLTADEIFAQRARGAWLARTLVSLPNGRPNLDFDPLHVSQFRMSAGARVRIEMDDGRSFEAEEEVPEGAAGRAYDDRRKAVEDKFRRETRYTLRKERMEKAVDGILHLEKANAASVREIVRLCCSERT